MYPSLTGRGWIYPYVRRVWGGYYCSYPSFPVTQILGWRGSRPRRRRRGQPRGASPVAARGESAASSSGRCQGRVRDAIVRSVQTLHLLPRVFVCFHLSPSNTDSRFFRSWFNFRQDSKWFGSRSIQIQNRSCASCPSSRYEQVLSNFFLAA